MKKLISALGIILLFASMSMAVTGPIPIDESNVLSDGPCYGTVTVTLLPDYCTGPYDGVRIVVDANQLILIPGTNFGIQAFGFNYNGTDLSNLSLTRPSTKWKITTSSNMSEFGVFMEEEQGTGNTRQDPLTIDVCNSSKDLIEGDVIVKNSLGYTFAAHIADFTYDDITYADSAFFATQKTTFIELSAFTAKANNGRVKLQWVTESEIDNAGFNIYRAESEDGFYNQINDELIPAKGSPTSGAKYIFNDTIAKNRKTYFYKLEDIDVNGIATMHGPVSATPKLLYGLFQ